MAHTNRPDARRQRGRFMRLLGGVGFVFAAVGWLIVNEQRRRARVAIRNAVLHASPRARARLGRIWRWWRLHTRDPWGRCRAQLVAEATGAVLEIGVGRWPNLKRYHTVARLVGVESNRRGVFLVRRRIRRFRPEAEIVYSPLAALPFADASFDTVVSSLALCTAPEPAATLREVARVLRPGGRFLFLEHVRARNAGARTLQTVLTPLWCRVADGCHLNRDTLATIAAAGFQVTMVAQRDGGWWLSRPTYHGCATPPELVAVPAPSSITSEAL
jgi:SAM-dependent methyltransferase